MLSLRLLYTFTIVAEELHFGRAAERLHMTQPPLSQQIRQLEQLIDAELFHRTTRSVRLTPAGKVLLTHARKLLLDAEAALGAAKRAACGEGGTIAVGFTASSIYRVLPRLVAEFKKFYPEVQLKLQEMSPEKMLEELHAERLDVVLLRPPAACFVDPRLTLTAVAEERMMLAIRADHPLARLASVPIDHLDNLPFIAFSPEQARYSHELCQRLFLAGGVRPDIVQESIMPTMLALVEAGIGAALVPGSVQGMWGGAIQYKPLAGDVDNVTTLYVACKPELSNPAARHFIRVAEQLDYNSPQVQSYAVGSALAF